MAFFQRDQQGGGMPAGRAIFDAVIDFLWFRPGELGAIVGAVLAPKPAKIIYRYCVIFMLIAVVLITAVTTEIEATILFLILIKAALKALYRQGFFQFGAKDGLDLRLSEMARHLQQGDERAKQYAAHIAQAAWTIANSDRNPGLAQLMSEYSRAYEASGHTSVATTLGDASRRLM